MICRLLIKCNQKCVPSSGKLSNGFQAPNREGISYFGMGMCDLGNAGNPTNMNNDNIGEATSANKEFNRIMDEYINEVIPEYKVSIANF